MGTVSGTVRSGISRAISTVCSTYCGSSSEAADAEPAAGADGTASRALTCVSAPGTTRSESSIERIVIVPKDSAGGGLAPVIARSSRCSEISCLYCRSSGCLSIDSPVTSL